MSRLLLCLDDLSGQQAVEDALKDLWRLHVAQSATLALRALRQVDYEAVLVGRCAPHWDDGVLALVHHIRFLHPQLPIIVLDLQGHCSQLAALQAGALDYVSAANGLAELPIRVQRALEARALGQQPQVAMSPALLVGESAPMLMLKRVVQRLSGVPASMLICGETGTGKELVARLLAYNNRWEQTPFVAVDAATIPESCAESILFGHERGAFTGADTRKIGLFEQAHRGTLLIDEIGNLSLNIQAKLLRVAQEQVLRRVGGITEVPAKVRIIGASHVDLAQAVKQGTFREDLWHRLAVFEIKIPPLRERREDIALLVEHFLTQLAGRRALALHNETLEILQAHAWPGNVRELQNTLIYALAMNDGEMLMPTDLPARLQRPQPAAMVPAPAPLAMPPLTPQALPAFLQDPAPSAPAPLLPTPMALPEEPSASLCTQTLLAGAPLAGKGKGMTGKASAPQLAGKAGTSLRERVVEFERELIIEQLRLCGGNVSQAARVLGIERSSLYGKLRRQQDAPLPQQG